MGGREAGAVTFCHFSKNRLMTAKSVLPGSSLDFPVNLSLNHFTKLAGVAQLARVSAFQAEGCGFDPRLPLHFPKRVSHHFRCTKKIYFVY